MRWMMLSCVLAACAPAAADEKPRVYTNEDLERVAPFRDQTGVSSEPAVAPARAAVKERPERGSARDEHYWRQQADRTAEQVRRLREQAAALSERIEARRSQTPARPYSDPQVMALESKRQALEARIREAEQRLEERARRAGALPGWLR